MMRLGLIITVLSTAMNFGTIREQAGKVSHRFVLHNESEVPVRIIQTYPSCGCTTISCDTSAVAPHDSTTVDVTFDPVNRGGDFYETASIVCASASDTSVVTLSVEGTVVTSEETLMKQYPVRQGSLRLTSDTLRMGEVRRGDSKTMNVGVLRDLKSKQRLSVPVTFTADEKVGWGLVSKDLTVPVKAFKSRFNVHVVAVVLPKFTESLSDNAPVISSQRRISADARELRIENRGKSPLIIYRAYTEDGTDLLTTNTKSLSLSPSESKSVSLSKLKATSRRITLVTNDPRRPRYVVTIQR
jgi:hypothetical protein